MVDRVTEIREALALQDDVESAVLALSGMEWLVSPIGRVFDAARAYADLLDRGVEVWAWVEPYEGMFFYTDDDLDLVRHGRAEGHWFFEDERRYFVAAVVPVESVPLVPRCGAVQGSTERLGEGGR